MGSRNSKTGIIQSKSPLGLLEVLILDSKGKTDLDFPNLEQDLNPLPFSENDFSQCSAENIHKSLQDITYLLYTLTLMVHHNRNYSRTSSNMSTVQNLASFLSIWEIWLA